MSIPKPLKFKSFTPRHVVMIKTLTNGYTVEIGCKSFVVGDIDDLMKELYAYLKGEDSDFNKAFKGELGEHTIEVVCEAESPEVATGG